jgi:ribose transport system substrate-binding protein
MFRRAVMTAALCAFAAGLSACGSSDSGDTTTAGTTGKSASGAPFMAQAEKAARAASGTIAPTVPTSGPKAQAGKTIVTIPCAAAAQGCKIAVDYFTQAAKAIGWKTLMIDPAGDPNKMANAINTAVSTHADGIFTVAIDAATVAAPLAAAKKAGLHAVCFSCVNQDDLLDGVIPAADQHERDGYAVAAQAYIDTGGHPKIILMRDNEFGNTRGREAGVLKFVKDCKAAGGDCEVVAEQNVLIANINTSVPQQAVSVARQHPEWNALIAPYDAILTAVVPALKSAGVVKDGKAYGFDPVSINTGWIRDGNVEAATVASPYRWIGYAAVDQLNRAFAGQPLVDQGVKDKLVTKANVPPAGQTYLDDQDPSGAFEKLWGVG